MRVVVIWSLRVAPPSAAATAQSSSPCWAAPFVPRFVHAMPEGAVAVMMFMFLGAPASLPLIGRARPVDRVAGVAIGLRWQAF